MEVLLPECALTHSNTHTLALIKTSASNRCEDCWNLDELKRSGGPEPIKQRHILEWYVSAFAVNVKCVCLHFVRTGAFCHHMIFTWSCAAYSLMDKRSDSQTARPIRGSRLGSRGHITLKHTHTLIVVCQLLRLWPAFASLSFFDSK